MLRFLFLFGLLTMSTLSSSQSAVQTNLAPVDAETTFVAPRFPGCEDNEVPGKYKYLCSQKKLVTFLDRYIRYPKDAVKATVQGKVIVSFIVEMDGTTSNAIIVRSPNESLGRECLNAVNQLNAEEDDIWKPAMLNGEIVRSRVELPVDFRIGYKSIKSKKPITNVSIPDLMPSEPVDIAGKALIAKEAVTDPTTVYDDVEESPYFKSCRAKEPTLIERYKCSREAYNTYIKDQLVYPESARLKRVQGIAKVECIIEIDGSISAPRLLRDPGNGLGQEALRLISQMKDSVGLWTPGDIGGQAVRTMIELPVRFMLSEDDISPLVVVLSSKKKVIHDCIRIEDPSILASMDGARLKELSEKKAQKGYGEKGRYGVYTLKLPKGKGKLPAPLRNQEEVEAYEMYFDGLGLDIIDSGRKIALTFDQVKTETEVIVYGLNGRTYLKDNIETGSDISKELDLTDARGDLFMVSIIQKDLVHTRIIKL